MKTNEIQFGGKSYVCRIVEANDGEELLIAPTTLLDALQPFGGGELAEDLFDFVSNARDFPGERIKDGKATLTKYLADDVPHIFKMVAQQGNHRNHGSKACNRWAEGSKQ